MRNNGRPTHQPGLLLTHQPGLWLTHQPGLYQVLRIPDAGARILAFIPCTAVLGVRFVRVMRPDTFPPLLYPDKLMAKPSRPAPVILVVLDGWGYRAETEGNAIAMAKVPTWDRIWERGSRTLLHASGEAVGLPEAQIDNSEVGRLKLGAGRVVLQELGGISGAQG